MKGLNWRIFTVVSSIVFAVYLLMPSVLKFGFGKTVSAAPKADDPWYYHVLPSQTLKLGLDLQGGLHLVLGIDFDEVARNGAAKLKTQITDLAEHEKISGITAEVTKKNEVEVHFETEDQWKQLDKVITRDMGTMVDFGAQTKNTALLMMSATQVEQVHTQAIEQSLETLRNRIDEFGIAEPIIQRQGEDKILVQFPGVQDTGRLRDIISRTAKLSFQIVRAGPDVSGEVPFSQLEAWVAEYEKASKTKPDPSQPMSLYVRKLNEFLESKLPKGSEILFQKHTNVNTREVTYQPYLLAKDALVTGEDLEDAYNTYDPQTNDPKVDFKLTPTGATRFDKATGDNVGRLMAIVLDNNVHSAPRIKQRISGGRAQIEMGSLPGVSLMDRHEDAKDTALVLRSGALPARLLFLEERVIGPSLGADAIRAGSQSFAVGLAAVFLFLSFYYRLSGVVATGALILNALFVLAMMAAFEGTLTLPGLAGLTLSLGMAVDANVLIFEHMREEILHGKSVSSAIAEGFTRSWSAILDGNLTTIIASLVLISFGYGPIRGFAVTTLIGLTCSMYTAVFCTRVVFDAFVVARNRKTLSI
ncbi:protein translocase subunit SecD [bacterium]|nr:protein translocase subunit SecD [bacterium]